MLSSKKVILSNESESSQSMVGKILLRLNFLKEENKPAFDELYHKCEDNSHGIPMMTGKLLRGFNLLKDDGSVDTEIRNIVLSAIREENDGLILLDPIKKNTVKDIANVLTNVQENKADTIDLKAVQEKLFAPRDTADRGTERQRDFDFFLKSREIKEEDYPLIAELYTYPNDDFIRRFHNTINFEQEKFSANLERSMNSYVKDYPELKRFFELILQFSKKYDRTTVHHFNRTMEDKKEFTLPLHLR